MTDLFVQIHSEDKRGYINEHKDFYFLFPPSSGNSKPLHNEIARYIEYLINGKDNNKIVLKKFERD